MLALIPPRIAKRMDLPANHRDCLNIQEKSIILDESFETNMTSSKWIESDDWLAYYYCNHTMALFNQ